MKPFAKTLRAHIDASGKPVSVLATEAGLTRAAIYHLLNGTRTDPPWSTVCKLADALRVGVESFRGA